MQLEDLEKKLNLPSPLEPITYNGFSFLLKRDDLIHPSVSGNKWRKLKYNLKSAIVNNHSGVASFGGAFSNHLYALAAACKEINIKSIGFIRGEYADLENPTLSFCRSQGMEIIKIPIEEYTLKEKSDIVSYHLNQKDYLLIPEGGSNALALKGTAEILFECAEQQSKIDLICISAGTGTTAAGIINATEKNQMVFVFNALKNSGLDQILDDYCPSLNDRYQIIDDYHFGGFAKVNPSLIEFINGFKSKTSIPLDPLYTSKMMFGLQEMYSVGKLAKYNNIVCIHTGGLQGILGHNQRYIRKDSLKIL